jgi:hypothetical protein
MVITVPAYAITKFIEFFGVWSSITHNVSGLSAVLIFRVTSSPVTKGK